MVRLGRLRLSRCSKSTDFDVRPRGNSCAHPSSCMQTLSRRPSPLGGRIVNDNEGDGDRDLEGTVELAVNPIAFPCCTGPSNELFGRMPVSEAKLDNLRLKLDCDVSSLSDPIPLTAEFLLFRLVLEVFG